MTDLVAPSWMESTCARADEHWHATAMSGGWVARIIVTHEGDRAWTARTQLLDRSLRAVGASWTSERFRTHAAAYEAGRAAAEQMHEARCENAAGESARTIAPASVRPAVSYQSRALQRYALAQQAAMRSRTMAAATARRTEAKTSRRESEWTLRSALPAARG